MAPTAAQATMTQTPRPPCSAPHRPRPRGGGELRRPCGSRRLPLPRAAPSGRPWGWVAAPRVRVGWVDPAVRPGGTPRCLVPGGPIPSAPPGEGAIPRDTPCGGHLAGPCVGSRITTAAGGRTRIPAVTARSSRAGVTAAPAGVTPTRIRPPRVDPARIGPARIGPARIGPAGIGPAGIGPAGIGAAGIAPRCPGTGRRRPRRARGPGIAAVRPASRLAAVRPARACSAP